jgi:hypothetical protein
MRTAALLQFSWLVAAAVTFGQNVTPARPVGTDRSGIEASVHMVDVAPSAFSRFAAPFHSVDGGFRFVDAVPGARDTPVRATGSRRDRSVSVLDYHCSRGDWPAVIDASRLLETRDFNSLTRSQINLALYEMNRLGDEMFRFPQDGSLLPELRTDRFLPHMLLITDLCLRLGRVADAERFGSEAMVLSKSDPRSCRLLAEVNLIKGQIGVARKFLTALSRDAGSAEWAHRQLRDLDRDPQLDGDANVQILRRRMLRKDDMLVVWYRADRPGGDMERLLLDQLEQDPSNRMAFEFLIGSYLVARDLAAVGAVMPRIKDITGPAYIDSGGQRRTPYHFQEAMAIYAALTGHPLNIAGLEVERETFDRMAAFKRILARSSSRKAAQDATWSNFRHSYFFYFVFGPGDYR